jgi:hypothetical protein
MTALFLPFLILPGFNSAVNELDFARGRASAAVRKERVVFCARWVPASWCKRVELRGECVRPIGEEHGMIRMVRYKSDDVC